MFLFTGFTESANNSINMAIVIASKLGHNCIGSEHMLYGLTADETIVSATLLSNYNITKSKVKKMLIDDFGKLTPTKLTPNDLTPRSKRILEKSINEANNLGHNFISSEHILLSILKSSLLFFQHLLLDQMQYFLYD